MAKVCGPETATIKFQITDRNGITPLMWLASKKEEIGFFEFALKYSDMDARDRQGETALSKGVRAGNIEAVSFLVQKAAEL
jgi:ankyrin repeat protein